MLDRLIQRDKFVIKGQYLINFRKFLEQKNPGMFEDIRQESGVANLLASSKILVLKSNEIIDEAARRTGQSTGQILIDSNRFILGQDLNGVLKLFMRVSGTENVLKRGKQISKTYTDYFDIEILKNEKGLSVAKVVVLEEFKNYLIPSLKGAAIGVCNVCKTPMKSYDISEDRTFVHKGFKLSEFVASSSIKNYLTLRHV